MSASSPGRRLKALISRLPEPPAPRFQPIRVLDIELSEPMPRVAAGSYGAAHALLRLHGHPLASVVLDLSAGDIAPDRLAEAIRSEAGAEIDRHLREDGFEEASAAQLVRGVAAGPCRRSPVFGPDAPLATVVVPTHNRPEKIGRCVDALLRMSYPNLEVVVVDNAPADARTRRLIAERARRDGRLRYELEPVAGGSRARNAGIRAARGDIVAFTDDDVVVDPRWLSALVQGFADPRVSCVSGLTLPVDLETPAQAWFERYGGFARGFAPRRYDLHDHRGDTLFYPYTAGVFGASNNAAFRRGVLVELGGFDTRLGPGSAAFTAEDLDLFLSVVLSGGQIAYQPLAVVRHEHRATYRDLQWQVLTYSIGLSVLVLKRMLADRAVAADVLRRLPAVLPAALAQTRGSGGPGEDDYPQQLRRLERLGYLYGPVAYIQSRRRRWTDEPKRADSTRVGWRRLAPIRTLW
jgi:O-antigen biosynthesis protein